MNQPGFNGMSCPGFERCSNMLSLSVLRFSNFKSHYVEVLKSKETSKLLEFDTYTYPPEVFLSKFAPEKLPMLPIQKDRLPAPSMAFRGEDVELQGGVTG